MNEAPIVHIITGLELGGAEMVLYHLLREARSELGPVQVISLRGDGPVGGLIRELGIPTTCLSLSGDVSQLRGLPRLRAMLRKLNPRVVQTWMYHADVLGGLAARPLPAPVVWGVHTGPPPGGLAGIKMKAGLRGCAMLSRFIPDVIVCCSRESLEVHRAAGYAPERLRVIDNGFALVDIDRLEARAALLAELNLDPEVLLVLRPGRLHDQKDHLTMMRAFARIAGASPIHLILVGTGLTPDNPVIADSISTFDLAGRVHLLGERRDLVRVMAGCDLTVSSSSFGEALPLVLGESMAVGTPVVTTDVGGSAALVGDESRVMPPRNPSALGNAIQRVLKLNAEGRAALGERDRLRVVSHFSVEAMADAYVRLYRELGET